MAKSRENEKRQAAPAEVLPRLGRVTAKPASGSLADRLDQLLAHPGNVLPLKRPPRKG